VRRHSYRPQRTLARTAEVRGIGFLTGAVVTLRFLPAPPSSGIVFVRTDLRPRATVPAHISQVTGTKRRTTLGLPPAQVGLVEHVLAALAGLRIDNCLVELDAPEPPGLDGSARAFVEALQEAGTVLQSARRPIWCVLEPVVLQAGNASLALYPTTEPELRLTYFLDYGLGSPIARQVHTQRVMPGSFAEEIASCRTFILQEETAELLRQGLGSRTTTADLLVFGPRGPINNRLRFANVVAYRSGHPLNIELVRALHERLTACGPACTLLAA
jgi:UDP-3-O-acyl-N-acetylglucosamine deacetylase